MRKSTSHHRCGNNPARGRRWDKEALAKKTAVRRHAALERLEPRVVLSTAPGAIFVGSPTSIGEYTTAGGTVGASLISGLGGPFGIAVSGSDVFVADYSRGTIGEYTTSGATVNATLVSGLNGPSGIAFSGSHLFVANFYAGTVGEYSTSGATLNASLLTVNDPLKVAISGSDLFVVNNNNQTVGEYTTSGAVVDTSLINLSQGIGGIACSGSDLFLANYGNGTIGEYTTSGATVNASLVTGLIEPNAIAISGSSLFVASDGNGTGDSGTIAEYTTSGATVNTSLVTGLDDPISIAVTVPTPSVSGISPASGPSAGGTTVAVSGSNFTGTTAVDFGSTPATSFMINNDSSITAVSPPGAGSVDVTVVSPGGTSVTSSADSFDYVAQPTVFTVDSTGSAPGGSGDSGTLPYVIGQANTNANPDGSEIVFDTVVFTSQSHLTIPIGGTLTLSEAAGPEIIEGPGAGALSISGGHAFQVFDVASGVTATISGLTVTGGSSAENGGGVLDYGTLTMTDCTISGNSAPGSGGGLWCDAGRSDAGAATGTATLSGCTIADNSAQIDGGGVFNSVGILVLTNNCTISGNSAVDSGGGLGNEYDGAIILTNCTISGNSAQIGGGGGLGNLRSDSTVSLTGCTISGNTAQTRGGGLENYGTATLTNCTISGNVNDNGDGFGGGGLWNYHAVTLYGCTISDNSTENNGGGGGVFNDTGVATLTNCTLAGNSAADRGGGLTLDTGTALITACTISGNTAGGSIGGGLDIVHHYDTIELTDTIIAGNAGSNGVPNDIGNADEGGTGIAASYNLIGVGGSGGITGGSNGNIVLTSRANLDLGALAYHGGPTWTIALEPGSVAIHTGTSVAGVTLDQRGDPLDSPPDIGAFQLQSTPAVTAEQATQVMATTATLNANVNPEESNTSVWFVYGTDPTLLSGTSQTPEVSVAAGASSVPVSAAITGLAPDTTYYYEAIAENSVGITGSSSESFQTATEPAEPTVAVNPGTIILGSTTAGTASSAQAFTVSGSGLTAGIVLTAPSGVELSDNGGSSFSTTLDLSETGGAVASTTIKVRISASASVGMVSGDIAASSTGATTQDVSITGSVMNSEVATTTAVTPGTVTVSYGRSPTFTATVSSAGGAPPDGSVEFLVNGVAYGSPTLLSGGMAQIQISESAGSYTITAQYTGDAHFATTQPAGETSATLTVHQAPLTITASNTSIVAGQSIPQFNVQYSGFVLGQGPSDLSGSLTVNTTASAASTPGSYAIVPGGLSSVNYSITYVSGTLTITSPPAPLVYVSDVAWQTVRTSRRKSTRFLDITYSGPVNAADATNPSAYTLDYAFVYKKHFVGYSVPVYFYSPTYNPTSYTVRLKPILKVPNKPMQLTINSSLILDAEGRELDGNDDGQPGGNLVGTLTLNRGISMARPATETGGSARVAAAIHAMVHDHSYRRTIKSRNWRE